VLRHGDEPRRARDGRGEAAAAGAGAGPALASILKEAEVDELRASLKTIHVDAPGASTLTAAELRLLPYLATHLTFPEMGERLYLSRHAVKSHAMAIYRKLSVTSRGDAVERARAFGPL